MKKAIFIVKSCYTCPYYKESPAQGANDHTCELRGKYLEDEYWSRTSKNKNRIHPDCPLEEYEEDK